MPSELDMFRAQVERQLFHWRLATETLARLDIAAAPQAWAALERYVGTRIRASLAASVDQLAREFAVVSARFHAARSLAELDKVSDAIIEFRNAYLRTETLIDFFGDAINTRTNPELGANLRALDYLAVESMKPVLGPLGRDAPPVMTYLDKGLGASILKAGLRLWDGGTLCPVAAIKVTFHNRRRATALVHETGHQVAHILDWNEELATKLRERLGKEDPRLAGLWAGWSSEIAADAYGFAHTGFASVAALADVVGGSPQQVFQYIAGGPHPISYLRVLLGLALARRFFGRGPWDDLEQAWRLRYPLVVAPTAVAPVLAALEKQVPQVAEIALLAPMRAFGGRALADLVDPMRVSPEALKRLAADAGGSLFSSPHWLSRESLRLLALTGYRFVTEPGKGDEIARLQDDVMRRIGQNVQPFAFAA